VHGLARAGITVGEFALGQPSLNEVFLALTGQPATSTQAATKEPS
jgi:ABC-2 type transport system ATP-binding protein